MTDLQAKILAILSDAGGAYVERGELAKSLGVSLPTIGWHVNLLRIRHGKTIEMKRGVGLRLVEAAQ